MSPTTTTTTPTYASLLAQLTPPSLPAPLTTPSSPHGHNPTLTPAIAALTLHPTLETLLHILNGDLTSAHFLVRHMQCPPKYEGMLLHALLHRVEGDYDNARAWYKDVKDSDVYKAVWATEEAAQVFVDDVQSWRKAGRKDGQQREEDLRRRSGEEVGRLARWCEGKFGTGAWADASEEWREHSEKTRAMAAQQTMGGEGWRKF